MDSFQVVVILGWMLSTATALAVLYGLTQHVSGEVKITREVAALYNSLHRTAWGASVCWVIYACANGYGGKMTWVVIEEVCRAIT